MTQIFDWFAHQLFQLGGYITGFFSFLYNAFIQTFFYAITSTVTFFGFVCSYLIVLTLYFFDQFLKFVIYILHSTFGGNAFGLVGLSTQYIEDNLQAILTVAPYAKICAYVLNFEALDNAFHYFLTFLLIWLCYRWFARWVRG